jgi:DNA-binding SARP family transcriptional activator
MNRLQLSLLGGFSARLDDESMTLPRKAQALLAYLAVVSGTSQPRDKLAALLWPETGEEQARHSLRQTLVSIKKAIGPDSEQFLVVEGDDLGLVDENVTTDVVVFERLLSEGSLASLADAGELYRGEFLEGLVIRGEPFEEWLLAQRERVWELAVEGLAKLLRLQMKGNNIEDAIKTSVRLLSLDPLQEGVHRTLMYLYLQSGRREAAVRQYHTCTQVLQRDLGMAPQPETTEIFQKIVLNERNPEGPKGELLSKTEGSTILVVEDDSVTRTFIEGLLRNAGYSVVASEDGADGLLKLGAGKFDLILSDINMPNLSGLKLLEIMTQKGIETPVIFITGLEDEASEVKGFEIGAADYLRKPIRKDALLVRVKNILRRRRTLLARI